MAALSGLQPLDLNGVAADLCEVILSLLNEPSFLGAAKSLGEPYRHFG